MYLQYTHTLFIHDLLTTPFPKSSTFPGTYMKVLAYVSTMQSACVSDFPSPKPASNKALSYLCFRYSQKSMLITKTARSH